jgi:hypothetical protein
MRTRVSTKGQLVLPPPPNKGVVDWLLACPERGYFVAIESESTDTALSELAQPN